MTSGDSLMAKQLALQLEEGGSIPTSPLQFLIREISMETAVSCNHRWHSRLPQIANAFACSVAYGAYYDGSCWAVAMWGRPVARAYNGKPVLELRRFAIAPQCPKNTASRMLAVMIRLLSRRYPKLQRVISYQDTDVHTGIIYRAAGWYIGHITKAGQVRWGKLNQDGTGRRRNPVVAKGDKVRWEKVITNHVGR